MDIKLLEFKFNIHLYPKWLPRSHQLISMADYGSKLSHSSDEYGISNTDFLFLLNKFNISVTCDGFASSKNCRVSKFISAVPQINCLDVDFFLHSMLSTELYYLNPPVNCIYRTINKIKLYSDITCLLVCPFWRSHIFWTSLVDSHSFKWFIKDYCIFNPYYVSSSKCTMFQGFKNFPSIAFLIKTNQRNGVPLPDLNV